MAATKQPDFTEYSEWIKSISFIDKAGRVLPTELVPDASDDPDDDREGVEAAAA